MIESKRGIKPIGNSSFLYNLTPEIIYNINVEEEFDGVKIMIIKMKKDNTWIYQYICPKEDFPSIIHPLKINHVLSNKDVIEDIKLLIYNNKFTINEIFDKILLQIIYDENNKKLIYLQLLKDDKDNLETKSNTELLEEIKRLNGIINIQKEKLLSFERKQEELTSKILKLESTHNQIISYLKNPNQNIQNPNIQNQNIQNQKIQNPNIQNQNNNMNYDIFRSTIASGTNRPNIGNITNNPFQNTNNFQNPFSHQKINSNINSSIQKNPFQRNTNPFEEEQINYNQYNRNSVNPYEMGNVYDNPFTEFKFNLTERITLSQSSIIVDDNEIKLINNWINPNTKNLEFSQIFKGSKYNFSAEIFHKLCDDKSPTLILFKCDNGARSGGYTTKNWNGEGQYKSDPNAFLFSLDSQNKYSVNVNEYNNAIYCRSTILCAFGNGYDLAILDQGKKLQSISNFPITYGYNTARKMGLLTGGFQKFYLEEIEVYHVLYSS